MGQVVTLVPRPSALRKAWNAYAAMCRAAALEPELADDPEFMAMLNARQRKFRGLFEKQLEHIK